MNFLKRRICLVVTIIFLGAGTSAHGQASFQQQYLSAKDFFKDKKYNLAMEAFKPLVSPNKDNPFTEYASYYYALSAYNQGYKSVAKDMFNQIKTLYPGWEQIDEVNLWLAQIHFENREYFQGLRILGSIKSNKLRKEATLLERAAIDSLEDIETLKMLSQTYPEDQGIGVQLAKELAKNIAVPENKELLELLIERFRLKKSDFIEEAPKTFYKDVYTVSVLFPFVVKTLDPTPTAKRNQFVLDLYEGMKLAVDTMKSMGIKIELRAYDTERSISATKSILEKEEVRNSDLIIGPLFQEMNSLVQDFSHQNKINTFNPISGNTDIISGNPYGFLFQPSSEVIGQKSAEFISNMPKIKSCIVFYGESKRDSVMAANFLAKAAELELKILMAPKIMKDNTKRILEILQTPTEFDEFKYPIQFTLPKDTVDCIFVASDDPLIYAKVIGSVETRGDSILILGSESWLDQLSIDYQKYQTLDIILFAPNFSSYSNPWNKSFQKKFISVHGRVPATLPYTSYSRIGFECMLFLGHALKKYGVYFQEGLNKEVWEKGFLSQAYDFRDSKSNQVVPFIRSIGGEFVLLGTK